MTPPAEETSWIIRNILITMLFFVLLFVVILLFLCCHCYRVWSRRSHIQNIQEARKALGRDPGPTIGWIDLSNQLCYDFFCWCFKYRKNPPIRRRYIDPNTNINGVIVPIKEYNNLLLNGYVPGSCNELESYDVLLPDTCSAAYEMCQPQCCVDTPTGVKIGVIPREERRHISEPTCIKSGILLPRQEYTCNSNVNQQPKGNDCGTSSCLPENSDKRNYIHSDQQPQDGTNVSRKSLTWNSNINQEATGGDSCLPENSDNRNRIRSEQNVQQGKHVSPQSQNWNQPNPVITPHVPSYPFPQPQNTGHGYMHQPHNLETYPISLHSGVSHGLPRPEFFGSGLHPIPTPYPWIPQPYMYNPYQYAYPLHNSIPGNSNYSPPSSVDSCNLRRKVQRCEQQETDVCCRKLGQHKPQIKHTIQDSVNKGQLTSRRRGMNCENSKMDKLQFVNEDEANESEPTSTGESEEESAPALVQTDAEEENVNRIVVDDDGYGSTNKLSENDIGGKFRDPYCTHERSQEVETSYISRRPKQSSPQKVIKRARLSPRYQQQCTEDDNAESSENKISQDLSVPCYSKSHSSEHAERVKYQKYGDSTSEDDKDRHCKFYGPRVSVKAGDRTCYESHRTQQKCEGAECISTNKLVRRGDLWSSSRRKTFNSQKRVATPKNEDIPVSKRLPKVEKTCQPIAPNKVKGILKNNSHSVNYNRSASSHNFRKYKDINMNRSNSRRRSARYRDDDEDCE